MTALGFESTAVGALDPARANALWALSEQLVSASA